MRLNYGIIEEHMNFPELHARDNVATLLCVLSHHIQKKCKTLLLKEHMKYPELHARDNVAALLRVRHLHGTSRSCSPS